MSLPAPRPARTRARLLGRGRVLRRRRQRGAADARRACVHRRRRQLGRPGGDALRAARQPRHHRHPRRFAEEHAVALPDRPHRARRPTSRCCRAPRSRRCTASRRCARSRCAIAQPAQASAGGDPLAVRLHRRRAADPVGRGESASMRDEAGYLVTGPDLLRGGSAPAALAARPRPVLPRNQHARRVRRRRRAPRLGATLSRRRSAKARWRWRSCIATSRAAELLAPMNRTCLLVAVLGLTACARSDPAPGSRTGTGTGDPTPQP